MTLLHHLLHHLPAHLSWPLVVAFVALPAAGLLWAVVRAWWDPSPLWGRVVTTSLPHLSRHSKRFM
jgi:hypothetical protein